MESDFRSKWSKGSLKSNAYNVKCVFHLRTLFYIRVKKGWSSKSKAIPLLMTCHIFLRRIVYRKKDDFRSKRSNWIVFSIASLCWREQIYIRHLCVKQYETAQIICKHL